MRNSVQAGVIASLLLAAQAAVPAAQAQAATGFQQSVELSGAMHAAARVCQDYSDEQLRDLKQQQKAHAVTAGMSGAQFDAVFQASYDKARTKLAQATPAQREKACAQVRALGGLAGAKR